MMDFGSVKLSLTSLAMEWTQPEPNRLDAEIESDQLLDAIHVLKDEEWGYLAAITGLDNGTTANTLSILYHFCSGELVLTLRVALPQENPVIKSITQIFPNAAPFERETGEMFGIIFSGIPDSSYLFLPDDWPEDHYPLRKEEIIDA